LASTDYVVIDTNVLRYFTGGSNPGNRSQRYRALLAGRRIALAYHAETELRGFVPQSPSRLAARDTILATSVKLPPGDATQVWYARAAAKRRELHLDGAVSDNDLWIIAAAAEYECPYMSHDEGACAVARSLGLEVLTAL